MFGPPTIELSPLFVGQREFPVALGVGETLPQRHGGPIARRELEELRKRTRWHGLIVSRVAVEQQRPHLRSPSLLGMQSVNRRAERAWVE